MRRKGRPETQGWLRRNTYLLLGVGLWSVVVGASLGINLRLEQQSMVDLALAEARVACQALIQLDSSLMARQIHHLGYFTNGIRGHITSLNPVSPENQPDDWERTAMKRLAAGAAETSEVRDIDGRSYLSLMRSLVIEPNCLQCHAGQGYKVGGIRGGLSVDVPMAPLWDAHRSHVRSMLAGYGMMWLIGLGALALAARAIRRRNRERRESENQYRKLFESSSDALFLIATDTDQIIEANSMASEIYGYDDRDELLTKKSTDMSAEPEETHRRIQETQTNSGQVFKIPLRLHRKKDGTVFPVEITARSLIREGQPVLLVSSRDITERKLAQDALRESGERHRAILQTAMNGFWLVDTQGRLLEVNETYCRMSGYSAEELLAMRIPDLVANETPDEVATRIKKIVAQGEDRFESLLHRKDGGVFDAEVSVQYRPTEGGQFVAFLRDITERKRAEEALRESEERFRLAIHATNDGLWAWDIQTNQEFFSPRWCEIIGYSFDDPELPHTYNSWASRIHPDDHDRVVSALNNHLEKGVKFDVDYLHRHKSGECRWQNSRGQAVFDESGKPTKMVGCISDISERKQAEERINRYVGDLESARDAQEKNAAELARMVEQLAVEKDRAEAATRAKSEFLSSMSHEIRTPMCGVIGMTGLLLDTPLTPEQQGYMQIVRSSGESLLGIINNILDFSKIEAGKLELVVVPFDLHNALEDVVELLAVIAHEKNLELLFRYAPDAPREFLGDPGRIRQVALNLVGNAIKFTERGHVLVEVGSMAVSGGLPSIRIAVHDTGIGIPADRQGLLFRKFQQADFSTTRKYGGTGLGLAISKQLVELMGGTLSLASQVGEGSTFSIEMPLRANALPRAEPEEGKWKEPSALPSFAGRRVLLVEDNIVNQKVGAAVLGKLGCRVEVAANGREALEALGMTSQLYDLIFMDCQMPEMDGYEATGEIRKREGVACHTPIIALTAGVTAEDRERCVQAGMDDYVSKPFRAGQLREMLDKYLGPGRPV